VGRVVIACYKPKPGKAEALQNLMKEHLPVLRTQGFVTERDSIIMVAQDGTLVEVFEWASTEAMNKAHANPAVQAMWQRFADVCDYIPFSELEEASQLFAEFAPL